MKKILSIAVLLFAMASCGVGTYSTTSGVSEGASLSFVADKAYKITVTVDGAAYDVNTVKLKGYRKDKSIKQTDKNTINLEPGKHEITVTVKGQEVKKDVIFLSNNESKVIEL